MGRVGSTQLNQQPEAYSTTPRDFSEIRLANNFFFRQNNNFPYVKHHIKFHELPTLQKLPDIPFTQKKTFGVSPPPLHNLRVIVQSVHQLLLLLSQSVWSLSGPQTQRHTRDWVWPLHNSCHTWHWHWHGRENNPLFATLKWLYLVFNCIFFFALLPCEGRWTLLNFYKNDPQLVTSPFYFPKFLSALIIYSISLSIYQSIYLYRYTVYLYIYLSVC